MKITNFFFAIITAAVLLPAFPAVSMAAEDLEGSLYGEQSDLSADSTAVSETVTDSTVPADDSLPSGDTGISDVSAADATISDSGYTDTGSASSDSIVSDASSYDGSSVSSGSTTDTSAYDEELFSHGGGYIPYIYSFTHPKNVNLPDTVTRYLPLVERYCAENGISEYVPYAMAIINNESGGTTMDVMGCKGEDPYSSIQEGCRLFALCIDDANEAGADINSAVQGYNYGSNFCFYVGSAGGIYTQNLSDMYAYSASGGERIPFPNSVGFGWIYNYGCQYYVGLTMSYLEEMSEEELAEHNAKLAARELDYVQWLRAYAEDDSHGYSDIYFKGTKNVNACTLIYLALQENGYLVGDPVDSPFDAESMIPTLSSHGFAEVPEAETDYSKLHAGDILIGDSILAVFVGDGCIVSAEDTEDAVAIRDIPDVSYQVYRNVSRDETLNDYTSWMVEHAYSDMFGYAKYGRNDPDVNESSFIYYALYNNGYLQGEDKTRYFDTEEEPAVLYEHGFDEITADVISGAGELSSEDTSEPEPEEAESNASETRSGTVQDPGYSLSKGDTVQRAALEAVPVTDGETTGQDGEDRTEASAGMEENTSEDKEPAQVKRTRDNYSSPVPDDFAGGKADLSHLRSGDILIGVNGENAVYVNNGRFVFAQDARESVFDYGAGDQSGNEITVAAMDDVLWKHVFRLQTKDEQIEEKNITGVLSWKDTTGKEHPEKICIRLVSDGKTLRKITVPATDGYTYTFAGVDAGIDYSIHSDDVPGYTKKYDGYNVSYTEK